jgi:site-specific recombinase XerC
VTPTPLRLADPNSPTRIERGPGRRARTAAPIGRSTVPPTGVPLVDAYLRALEGDGASVAAARERSALVPFCRWLANGGAPGAADSAVRALARRDLLAYVEHQLLPRRGRRLSPNVVYRRLVALRRFYAWAAARGEVAVNPIPPERRAPAARPGRGR